MIFEKPARKRNLTVKGPEYVKQRRDEQSYSKYVKKTLN